MPVTFDMDHFRREGYVILDVLSPDECARFRRAADAVMAQERIARERRFHYIPFILPEFADATLQESFQHPGLTDVAEAVLGGPLVLDNASLLAAEVGVSYRQGWHRDVLQVPQELITDEMFSPRWKHNNIQLNLALVEDAAFWAVPGSHQRPNTAEENVAFGPPDAGIAAPAPGKGTTAPEKGATPAVNRHRSPVDARMPGAQCLRLKPGQAAFYNNNLIHRGYCDFNTPRRTIHIGYHSGRHPPTWHFYNFAATAFTPEYLATLAPGARRWLEKVAARRREFPDVKASYRSGLR